VGPDSFSYKASDGSSDSNEATTTTINVDTIAPETVINTGPPAVTGDSSPSFAFSASESGSSFECRVDDGAFEACTTPLTLAPLADGPHEFEVRAIDLAGHTDQSAASRRFTVDTVAPDTTITAGPSGATESSTPTFEFSSSEADPTFQCSIDDGAFEACTTPMTLAPLADGPHEFEVRARDVAGNVDASPARRDFAVTRGGSPSGSPSADVTAPTVALRVKSTQKLGRSIRLLVEATGEDLWASLSGTVSLRGGSRIYKLIGVKNRFVAHGSKATLKVQLRRNVVKAIARGLRKREKVKATLTLTARDAARNVAVEKRSIRFSL
jgi:hypothetical protein